MLHPLSYITTLFIGVEFPKMSYYEQSNAWCKQITLQMMPGHCAKEHHHWY